MKNIFKYPFPLMLLFGLLVGCAENDEASESGQNVNNNHHPMTYITESEHEEQITNNLTNNRNNNKEDVEERYLDGFQSDLEQTDGQNGSYTQSFFNQDSETISKVVNELEEVRMSQTIVTDKQIIISAMLMQEHYDEDTEHIVNKISNRASQTIPNKEVIVYTDAIYWNKMRDLNSKIKFDDNPDQTQYHLDNFFNK
ncbi:hypothetical protein GH741_09900 [Aquibacillus halophilus]|uniref:Sporulation protein n=1 Tax=Aquibacillus halophilus TaxID=930132 RepID=A0A6A8DBJ6_9BACI|nr:YhcN/YlaJ family sporulation lipoprotein [Aquibacillus halophilus]MRH42998.1 hypothetical protein [Aquibacillus halophilus]